MRDSALDVLAQLFVEDMNAFNKDEFDEKSLREVSERHVAIVKPLVEEHGWPTNPDDEMHLVSIVLHADHDPEFQDTCLTLMKSKSPRRDLVAYLTDRVLVNRGQPQIFGTQVLYDGVTYRPYDIYKPEGVDIRRSAIGMEPMSSYLSKMREQ